MTCRQLFSSADEQRTHYKTDFHRFNLKRKIAQLAPITMEQFSQKVEALKISTEPAAFAKDCEVCGKRYLSEGAYQTHLQSNKHREAEKGKAAPAEANVATESKPNPDAPKENTAAAQTTEQKPAENTENNAETKEEPKSNVSVNNCLFCNTTSNTFKQNMKHMARVHSFYIPDVEYLNDVKDLIEYLEEKVYTHNMCLYCNGRGRGFHTVEAVQGHMRDCSHCKIIYEDNEEEYAEFYDFERYNKDWNLAESAELGAEKKDGEAEQSGETKDKKDKEPVGKGVPKLMESNMELVLVDSNKVLGHRALQVYYNQRPRNDGNSLTLSLMKEYRKLAQRERFTQTNIDFTTRQKMSMVAMRRDVKGNRLAKARFRCQNSL
jgi:pre-60S factor REI1